MSPTKARSSRNSSTDGLYSKELVLPNEDPAELDRLRASLRAEQQPINTTGEHAGQRAHRASSLQRIGARCAHKIALLLLFIALTARIETRGLEPLDIRAQSHGHSLYRGITLITLAFFCAAVMSALSKAAHGVPPLVILSLQYAISFLVFVPSAARIGRAGLKTDHFWLHLFRSLAGSVCQLLFFMSVRSIPLLDSVLLSNAAPLFIPLVVYVWFRKTVRPLVWLSLLIGLVGIVLIIKPGPETYRNPASLLALLAGLFSAIALVATNTLAETEPPVRILFYNFGLSTLLLIPLCIAAWKPLTGRQWLLILGVGGSYALTQYLIILAYRYAGAAELSPFNYTVVIFSGLLGWQFFGNVPDAAAILGTVLICAGGILSIRAGHSEGLGHSFGYGHWRLDWKLLRRSPA